MEIVEVYMSQINYPCRWCGGELTIIDDVVTCVKCHPVKTIQEQYVDELDSEMLRLLKEEVRWIDNEDVTYGRKPIRLKSDLYSRSNN